MDSNCRNVCRTCTHTLVQELELNWPGVEIVLRMRGELIDMRKQVAELLSLLQARGKGQ